ncbi:MAG: hypothetical protein COT88_00800, partial [Candidatus Colwellbacteria bacterium CG10_big_fil_rev_8_21_14_0_10_41_28]
MIRKLSIYASFLLAGLLVLIGVTYAFEAPDVNPGTGGGQLKIVGDTLLYGDTTPDDFSSATENYPPLFIERKSANSYGPIGVFNDAGAGQRFEIQTHGSYSTGGSSGAVILRANNNLLFSAGDPFPDLYISTAGNVGIGRANLDAGAKLDVAGKILLQDQIIFNANAATFTWDGSKFVLNKPTDIGGNLTLTSGVLAIQNGSVTSPGLIFSGDANTGIYHIGDDNLGLAVGGIKIIDVGVSTVGITGATTVSGNLAVDTSTLYVDASGNEVGIGTTSPSSKLDITVGGVGNSVEDTEALSLVNTSAAIANVTGDDGQQYSPALRWQGQGWKTAVTAASQSIEFKSFVRPIQGTAVPTGSLDFQASVNGGTYSDLLSITSGGNVGIGTTSPGYKLDVNGTLGVTGTLGTIYTSSTGNDLVFTRNAANYILASGASGALNLGAGGVNGALTIAADSGANVLNLKSGKVGIGQTSPAYTLDVTGTGRFTQPILVGTPTADGH